MLNRIIKLHFPETKRMLKCPKQHDEAN